MWTRIGVIVILVFCSFEAVTDASLVETERNNDVNAGCVLSFVKRFDNL